MISIRPLLADIFCWQARQVVCTPAKRTTAAEQATQLWALEPKYHLQLAWLYFETGNLTAIEPQLTAAKQLAPDTPSTWESSGALYALRAKTEPAYLQQAESAYRRALNLAPNVATYHTGLGVLLARQGKLNASAAAFKRAVALDATDSETYNYLAEVYSALGQNRLAQEAWRNAKYWRKKQDK